VKEQSNNRNAKNDQEIILMGMRWRSKVMRKEREKIGEYGHSGPDDIFQGILRSHFLAGPFPSRSATVTMCLFHWNGENFVVGDLLPLVLF
jgi:hypothetical protein